MLVLSRKKDQQLQIGDQITVTVLKVTGSRVQIGIEAPPNVKVLRRELAAGADGVLPAAVVPPASEAPRETSNRLDRAAGPRGPLSRLAARAVRENTPPAPPMVQLV